MSNMSVEDIINILSRNTIDGEAVEKTLISASVKNFKSLYDIQLDLVGLKRFDVPIQELVRVMRVSSAETRSHYPHRYTYTIPYSIISANSRKACKESGYYGKIVSQEEISQTPNIFNFNFIIWIGGKFIDTGEIIIRDAETVFILDVSAGEDTSITDGIPMEDYRKYYAANETVTFMVIPNYNFTIAEFNKVTFTDVMKRKIPYSRFVGSTEFNQDTTMFFMNTDTDKSTKRGISCTVDKENQCVVVPDNIDVTSTRLCVSAITLQNVHEIKAIGKGESCWFQLSDEYELPVPVENFVPFLKEDSGGLVFDPKISLKLYYPNIYKIENWDGQTDLLLYIMYDDTSDARYYNDLAILDLLSGKLVDRYENGSLPDIVTEYEPQNVSWLSDSEDFAQSVYFPKRSLYNINALSEIVLRNPHFLIEYAYLKLKSTPRYYINVAKLSLEDRVRSDTYQECQETGDIVFFDEPMYLFSLRRKFVGGFSTDFRIFIDNLFVCPLDYTLICTVDFFHFYIPCSIIKEDSIIELEKYTEYDFRQEVTFDDVSQKITIEIPKSIKKIFTRDITVIDLERGVYLGESEYKITAYSDIMEEDIKLDGMGYATIKDRFHVELTTEKYVGKKLLISVYHRLSTKNLDITKMPSPVQTYIVNNNFITADKLRVYTGGLLLPTSTYSVTDNWYYHRDAEFTLFVNTEMNPEKYKRLTVDSIPNGQTCEFHLDHIDNEYGFVDTGNALSLPLDLKWYDIYVNGLKLNKSNVDIVTSNKFFIKGIDTRKNLYIYARGDVYNEFDILHEETEENKLFHAIDEIYEELLKDRDIIQDTMTDIAEDLMTNLIRHFEFIEKILEYSFINANEQQVTEEIRTLFPELIDENGILWLDSNSYLGAWVTMINSNKRSDYMKNDQYRYGWSPLYIGSHEDALAGEYMCDPNTGAPGMKNSDGSVIPIGELDRLNVHKANLQNSLGNNGLLGLDIYHVQFNENTTSKNVIPGENILDDEITINEVVTKAVLSLDLQILKRGYMDVMTASSYIPNIEVQYTVSGESDRRTVTIPYNDLQETILDVYGDNITIHSIVVNPDSGDENMDHVKCILHSILLAI